MSTCTCCKPYLLNVFKRTHSNSVCNINNRKWERWIHKLRDKICVNFKKEVVFATSQTENYTRSQIGGVLKGGWRRSWIEDVEILLQNCDWSDLCFKMPHVTRVLTHIFKYLCTRKLLLVYPRIRLSIHDVVNLSTAEIVQQTEQTTKAKLISLESNQ